MPPDQAPLPALQPPIGDLAPALAVAGEACALVKSSSTSLAKLTKELKAGELNFCIARGCIRSLQDVLVTLVRHTSLLLKDIVLRLDFWNDLHESEWRIRVRDDSIV
jgi:hypothetical protein